MDKLWAAVIWIERPGIRLTSLRLARSAIKVASAWRASSQKVWPAGVSCTG
ncbi:hypothetical protein D3C77_627880 [compost metagenome]